MCLYLLHWLCWVTLGTGALIFPVWRVPNWSLSRPQDDDTTIKDTVAVIWTSPSQFNSSPASARVLTIRPWHRYQNTQHHRIWQRFTKTDASGLEEGASASQESYQSPNLECYCFRTLVISDYSWTCWMFEVWDNLKTLDKNVWCKNTLLSSSKYAQIEPKTISKFWNH